MKAYAIYQGSRLIAARVALADSFLSRFKGLMFRRALEPGEGLLLKNCSAIHCCFMRFPIDVVYLDHRMQVVAVETVRPWRLGGIFPGTKDVLELEAGSAQGLVPGMQISWKECMI